MIYNIIHIGMGLVLKIKYRKIVQCKNIFYTLPTERTVDQSEYYAFGSYSTYKRSRSRTAVSRTHRHFLLKIIIEHDNHSIDLSGRGGPLGFWAREKIISMFPVFQ